MQDSISVDLPYNDINNNGFPETGDFSHELPFSEDSLAVFVYNGNEWKYTGGNNDSIGNSISFSVQNAGIFCIFPATDDPEDDKIISIPRRYCTPDKDGLNDCVRININPGKEVKVDIRIYSLSGKLVNELVKGVSITGSHSVDWCGISTHGKELPIGPYLYEVRFDGEKKETGVLLLVK